MSVKRLFDIVVSLILIAVFVVPMACIVLIIRMSSPGPAFYWSDRIGAWNKIFKMAKFRTMRVDTPVVATHLLRNADKFVTSIGAFLRQYSLDELPQLYNILKGEMSIVGPRPALYNQHDLIALRTAKGIHVLLPGLTGWAQVNGRDELSIPTKVAYDEYYFRHRSFIFDLKIVWMTTMRVAQSEGVHH